MPAPRFVAVDAKATKRPPPTVLVHVLVTVVVTLPQAEGVDCPLGASAKVAPSGVEMSVVTDTQVLVVLVMVVMQVPRSNISEAPLRFVAVGRGNQVGGGHAAVRRSDGDERRDVAGIADVNLWGYAIRCNVGDQIGRQRNERDVLAIGTNDRIVASTVPGRLAVGRDGDQLRIEIGARRNHAGAGGCGHANWAPIHLGRAVLYRDG